MDDTDKNWHGARSVGLVIAVIAVVLGIYWQTSLSMVEVWGTSGTYSHGFLILPVFLWLVWDRRQALSQLAVRPSWPGLFGLAALGLGWLLGDLASAAAPTQFVVVAIVPVAVATVLGIRWVRALAFPFAFLFFAVPFGEWLVPYMMDWTADFTVGALKLSGVPVFREGTHFSIPSGNWSVIEACSGIRYVFACLATATLFAWTVYRSTKRRLIFVGAALAIAVLANWVRAYTIVMAAHLIDYRLAIGIDHVVYGGLFFGVVMAIVLLLGVRWREDDPGEATASVSMPAAQPAARAHSAVPARAHSVWAALIAATTLLVWPLASPGTARQPLPTLEQVRDIEPMAGWVRVEEPQTSWQPQLTNPSRVRLQVFAKNGRYVSVFLGIFDRSTHDSKLTSSVNKLVGSQDPHWTQVQWGVTQTHRGKDVSSVRTATLAGPEGRITAWSWYWVDGAWVTSPVRAVLGQLLARLRGRSEMSAWVTVHATEDGQTPPASVLLEDFMSEMHDSMDRALRETASGTAQ